MVTAWAEVKPDQIDKIKAALPAAAPGKPAKARKLLVYSRTRGFRHSSIAVGQEAMKQLGEKTGAFTATITEDPAYFEPDTQGIRRRAHAEYHGPVLFRGSEKIRRQSRQGRAAEGGQHPRQRLKVAGRLRGKRRRAGGHPSCY